MSAVDAPIERLTTGIYRFPTPEPEADGTLKWDATVAVTVQAEAAGCVGLGWTYSTFAASAIIDDHLAGAVRGCDAADTAGAWSAMHRACRNLGTKGLVMQAISAVDIAIWDLKARLLDMSLARLLGGMRTSVPIYGSGGFTTLDDDQLKAQVDGWTAAGCTAMKIKIGESWGRRVDRDLQRVRQLREIAGPDVQLMVDANGGYTSGQARRVGSALDELGVVWFEEPVSSDDVHALALLRAGLECDVTAGEYASDSYDAARLAPVVDCLQLDVTRCGGYTGWERAAAVAAAHNLDVSGHCAPALHAPIAAAIPNLRHVEYFIDHARLEPLLVDGAPAVTSGRLYLDPTAIGHGMTLSEHARPYQIDERRAIRGGSRIHR
ncbi:MAG TPA: enolase C-terminal domain-like protein [Frankiaceae bacterium]|nr:enolase C-terminal domain-like protein [Frankiaceae bacterium]